MRIAFTLLAFFLVLGAQAQTEWKIEDDYQVRFSGQGADGNFTGLEGTIVFSPAKLSQSKFDVKVDARTIDTGTKRKDEHAIGRSWLEAAYHPDITFKSDSVVQTAEGFEAFGKLNLHGIEGDASIPFTFKETPTGGVFDGNFKVNRKSYGIMGNFASGMVDELFRVDLHVPVRRPTADDR